MITKKARIIVISAIASILLFCGGAAAAYKKGMGTFFIPPEWVLSGAMALHVVSPDESIDGKPLIRFIFDFGTGVIHPEAQADVALRYGADIDARDQQGWTALMEESRYGGSGSIMYLIAHGAKPDLEDRDGNTALLLADDRSGGWPFSISGLLLAAGTDPCHSNHKGETPAMHFGLNTPLGHMLDEVCKEQAK